MPRRQNQAGRLSVFKGREAKLNKAIFHTLAHKSPQTIYDMYKQIKTQRGLRFTKYASVNKRTKALEGQRYIKKAGVRKTKAGFEVIQYELTARAHLSLLFSSLSLEDLIIRLDEAAVTTLLALALQNL